MTSLMICRLSLKKIIKCDQITCSNRFFIYIRPHRPRYFERYSNIFGDPLDQFF